MVWLLYGPGPFGEFVPVVHGGLGLGGSPRPARVAVARVVLQTLTGVGTRGVETLGMTATQVSTHPDTRPYLGEREEDTVT